MNQDQSETPRSPKGVTRLDRDRAGRRFLARIRRKGLEVHLGLYPTSGLAAFAFNVASEAIGRTTRPPNEIPRAEQPDADQVRLITARVRRRLGLDPPVARVARPPDPASILLMFEVVIIGFWRDQAARSDPGPGLDSAARRLAESADLIFGLTSLHPFDPLEVIARLVGRRLDQAFRRSDLTRAVLDDDDDEGWRVARWLVWPEVYPGARGFRDEVVYLYPEHFEVGPESRSGSGLPGWAAVLGLNPPFSGDRVRQAYRTRSKTVHPDAGGSHAEFIQLRAAYVEALEYCRIQRI